MDGHSPDRPDTAGRIGVLGGGQLGRMLAIAGLPLGFGFEFLDPAADACAGAAGRVRVAAFDDAAAARSLGELVDVATFDFENVPEASARALEENCPLYPASNALAAAQDRLTEKGLLANLGIPVPDYHPVSSRTDLLEGLERLGYPAVLKTRRLGYDGKGQAVLRDPEDRERAWQRLGEAELILETFVPFEAECSLVAVRGREGETRCWPLTRNVHRDGILTLSLAGGLGASLQEQASAMMEALMDHLGYCGVLTIEFFLVDGALKANEIAPRVHNSGHWTIDGSPCSQFENHVRAIAGLPLGSTARSAHALMFNWIGSLPDRVRALAVPGTHWHDYGKAARPGRKVGHATVTAESHAELRERAERLAAVAGDGFPGLVAALFDDAADGIDDQL
jgi:5-(carboxyamino)imidazole ribonucleotide synthase